MQAWNVYLDGRWIDTVFYSSKATRDYVLDSLVDHDGYDPEITVRRKNKIG